MSQEELLKEISRKLDVLVKVAGYQLVGAKTIAEGGPVLQRLGLSVKEIASIYESTSESVRVGIILAKKRRQKKKEKKRSKPR